MRQSYFADVAAAKASHSTVGTATRATLVSMPRTRSRRSRSTRWKRARLKPTSPTSTCAPPRTMNRLECEPTISTIAAARSSTLVSTELVRPACGCRWQGVGCRRRRPGGRAAVGRRRCAARGVRRTGSSRRSGGTRWFGGELHVRRTPGRGDRELGGREEVPADGQVPQESLQPQGRLDVGQRVAAAGDEGVGRAEGSATDGGQDRRDGRAAAADGSGSRAGSRPGRGPASRAADGRRSGRSPGPAWLPVGLRRRRGRRPGRRSAPGAWAAMAAWSTLPLRAARAPRRARRRHSPPAAGRWPRQRRARGRGRPARAGGPTGRSRRRPGPGVGGVADHPGRAQARLDPVEVDAQPEDLGEAAQPTHDLEPVGRPTDEVAGAQLLDLAAEGQVGRALGVAEHHVVAAEHQLADGLGRAARRADRADRALAVAETRDAPSGRCHAGTGRRRGRTSKEPPGTGSPSRVGVAQDPVRGEHGHPGGRLGGAVHEEEVEAAPQPELGVPRRRRRRAAGRRRRSGSAATAGRGPRSRRGRAGRRCGAPRGRC